ncbi:MAG: hypothetical protein JWR83_717 [Aeromicrobium sp.]|nr:hypothetical protein [Aeromicrobium sp.]
MTIRGSLVVVAAVTLLASLATSPADAVTVAPPAHPTIATNLQDSVVVTGGSVRGAGANNFQQLGAVDNGLIDTLTALPELSVGVKAVSVDSDSGRTVVIGDDGRAYAAGPNFNHQLTGTTASNTYAPFHLMSGLPISEQAVEASITQHCTVILTESGHLYRAGLGEATTGSGQYGQCPMDPLATEDQLSLMPGIPAGRTVVDVAVGGTNEESIVAALDDGSLIGAGWNRAAGQLPGHTVSSFVSMSALTPLPGSVKAIAVSMGGDHLTVLGNDGAIYGSGGTSSGQLTAAPIVSGWRKLTGLPIGVSAAEVVSTFLTTLVLGDDGNLYATGNIDHFEPGGDPFSATTLTLMPMPAAMGPVTEIDGREDTFLVRGDNGFVWGAGGSSSSQLTGSTGFKNGLRQLTGQLNIATIIPSFTGTLKYGSTLTAHTGTWVVDPDSFAYQWRRNGVAIPGAIGTTYKLTKADAGRTITLVVTAVTTGFADTPDTSLGGVVAPQIFNTTRPTISGTAKVGKKLSIKSHGHWTVSSLSYTYRWLRNGSPIGGAVHSTYTLKSADNNKKVTLRITAKRSGYISATAISSNYRRP